MGYIYYDNKIQDENDVNIGLKSVALNYGLGCFEGIRAYYDKENDKMVGFLFKEHYQRLLNSCKVLNLKLNLTVEELCSITVELIKKNNFKCNTYIRPLAFKGSTTTLSMQLKGNDDDKFGIFLAPLNRYIEEDKLKVCVSSFRRITDNAIPTRIKSTGSYINSALATYEAAQNGYDEAIFLKEDGNVCEGPGENIFMVKNGKLITPPLNDGILEGLTRNLVIRMAKDLGIEVCERSIARSELYSADELFFSGTAIQVNCITSVDKRPVGDGEHGEIFKKLNDLFNTVTLGKNEKYKDCCTEIK